MKLFKDRLTAQHGYFISKAGDALDSQTCDKAVNYKKNVVKKFSAITPEDIDRKLGGKEFFITRKYDGEMNIIFYEDGQAVLINRSGNIKYGLACSQRAGELLAKAGIKQAVIPAELYIEESGGRTRVFEVLKALADENLTKSLRLAPFDIAEIDYAFPKASSFGDIYNKLTEIFSEDSFVKPVECKKVSSKGEIAAVYDKWVNQEGYEGLVVHTDSYFIYKIKPRFNLDVAVIGFSEGTGKSKGHVRTLLLAMMTDDGKYQVVGKTGGGMSVEFRKELYEKLFPDVINSYYMETDSDHVAFYMVQPKYVIEISVNDVLFESTSGPTINPILEIRGGAYHRRGECEGFSFVSPVLVRVRDDKTPDLPDIRLQQLEAVTTLPEKPQGGYISEMPKSEMLIREVYKKETKDKLMVRKFLVWKTNKENYPDYFSYVLVYTDFSSDRAEHLKRDIRVSNSREQIIELFEELKNDNVKKGWTLV